MAFRQPSRYVPPRIHIEAQDSRLDIQETQPREQLEESQEWILFSPVPPSVSNHTRTTSTEHVQLTAGRSRASDYGSLDTAARSYEYDDEVSEHTEAIAEEEEEDGELDSLDSHLHEFRAHSTVSREAPRPGLTASGNAVLPTHDGLGSFRINRTTMGDGVQEHLYSFERYNPRRAKRRRETLDLAQVDLEYDTAELDRMRRIEEWRLEQSRALLEEIRKETRRRRQSISTDRRSLLRDDEVELATMGSVQDDDSSVSQNDASTVTDETESFWTRITRKVIQDLIGIDDRILSIILGETLAEEELPSSGPTSSQAVHEASSDVIHMREDDTWEYRLLNRIARELGLLVHQLSEHPDAFSTYMNVHQMPLPYAGLPVIPEMLPDYPDAPPHESSDQSSPRFQPTLPISTQPLDISGSSPAHGHVLNDIDATPRPTFPIHQAFDVDESGAEFSKEEWEKQLDIKLIFRYLRSRFTSNSPPSSVNFPRRNSSLAAANPQDVAARAARVQQHHPLVTRQISHERRSYRGTVPGSPILHRKGGSSCASQSTRKSAKRNSGSSRHYWDINGSMGSGSLIASTGPMGSWGEV